MIKVCCSTCQSIGINMQEPSLKTGDYNGDLVFFVLKRCCVSEQALIWWGELYCLPSLRLAFFSLLARSPICTNANLPPRCGEDPLCLQQRSEIIFVKEAEQWYCTNAWRWYFTSSRYLTVMGVWHFPLMHAQALCRESHCIPIAIACSRYWSQA